MMITKNDILTIKGENNMEKYMKGRVNPMVYFKYMWDDKVVIDRERMYMSVELPTVRRKFI